jgi:hypothetical protein
MSEDSTPTNASHNRSFGQKLKRGFQAKILIPAATMVGTAAASYLIKKLPLILEEKVLPKLKEKGAPDQVTTAVERAATAVGAVPGTESGSSDGSLSEGPESTPSSAGSESTGSEAASSDDREEERRKREERRRERKRAMRRVA